MYCDFARIIMLYYVARDDEEISTFIDREMCVLCIKNTLTRIIILFSTINYNKCINIADDELYSRYECFETFLHTICE